MTISPAWQASLLMHPALASIDAGRSVRDCAHWLCLVVLKLDGIHTGVLEPNVDSGKHLDGAAVFHAREPDHHRLTRNYGNVHIWQSLTLKYSLEQNPTDRLHTSVTRKKYTSCTVYLVCILKFQSKAGATPPTNGCHCFLVSHCVSQSCETPHWFATWFTSKRLCALMHALLNGGTT